MLPQQVFSIFPQKHEFTIATVEEVVADSLD